MVKETASQEGFLLTAIIYFEHYIILVQLWVAGEDPTTEWSCLPRKIVREEGLSFRAHGDCILLHYKWSNVSQVGVGERPLYHQVMSDAVDDIQDPRYHMT